MKLTEKQWQRIAPLFEAEPRTGMVGRPATPARDVLNGVVWILKTGARWKDPPRDYHPYQTCHRRFQQWVLSGLIQQALQMLADGLRQRGGIDIREAFIDGTFSSAKRGVFMLARRSSTCRLFLAGPTESSPMSCSGEGCRPFARLALSGSRPASIRSTFFASCFTPASARPAVSIGFTLCPSDRPSRLSCFPTSRCFLQCSGEGSPIEQVLLFRGRVLDRREHYVPLGSWPRRRWLEQVERRPLFRCLAFRARPSMSGQILGAAACAGDRIHRDSYSRRRFFIRRAFRSASNHPRVSARRATDRIPAAYAATTRVRSRTASPGVARFRA